MKLEEFKNTIDNIKPDPYMETRLAQNVLEAAPKRRSKRKLAIAAVSGFLSLAVLITGLGFGFNYTQKGNSNDELSVLIAYASTEGFLNVGSVNKQEIFYSIHFAPSGDKEAITEARKKYDTDCNEVENKMHELGKEGYGAGMHYGTTNCYNEAGDPVAELFKVAAGQFALSLDDYSNVETFKVENSSEYGQLNLDYDFYGRMGYTDSLPTDFDDEFIERLEKFEPFPIDGHKFEISGDELRRSQDSMLYSYGSKYETNKGYTILWEISDELECAIGNNLNFDLSEIKDTITFTVEFTDGTVKTASLDLYFDSDGYMHFGK